MSMSGPVRMALRTAADALIGLMLFLTVAFAINTYERGYVIADQVNVGGLLAASSNAGDLMKFSLDDSPLIAAAVVATAVPVPHTGAISGLQRTTKETAFALFAGIFSALVALNLAFFRHLRREYASPR